MPEEEYVDDDPEYEADADDDSVLLGLAPTDPQSVPSDQGDPGKESA